MDSIPFPILVQLPLFPPDGKCCSLCKQFLPFDAFYRANSRRIPYSSACKACVKIAYGNKYPESKRAYKERNREAIRAYGRAYNARKRAEDPACWKRRAKEWAARDPERIRQYKAKAYARHAEERRAYTRAYYQAHAEERRAYAKAYAQANPDKIKEIDHRRRALAKRNGGRWTVREWQELKARYDYTCLMCGRREPEVALTLDHIVPLTKGGRNEIANAQPLCRSCNSSKYTKVIDLRDGAG